MTLFGNRSWGHFLNSFISMKWLVATIQIHIQSNLDFLVCAWGVLVHRHRSSDVAELVIVTVEDLEGPADRRDLSLNAVHSPHQLHGKRHTHPTVKVQLISIIRLHLIGNTESKQLQREMYYVHDSVCHVAIRFLFSQTSSWLLCTTQ